MTCPYVAATIAAMAFCVAVAIYTAPTCHCEKVQLRIANVLVGEKCK